MKLRPVANQLGGPNRQFTIHDLETIATFLVLSCVHIAG